MSKSLVDLIFENDGSLDAGGDTEASLPVPATSDAPEDTSAHHLDVAGLDLDLDVDGDGGTDLSMHLGPDGDLDIEIDDELLAKLRDMENELAGDDASLDGGSSDVDAGASDEVSSVASTDAPVVDEGEGGDATDPDLLPGEVDEKVMLNLGDGEGHNHEDGSDACEKCSSVHGAEQTEGTSEEVDAMFEGLDDDTVLEIDEEKLMEAMKNAKGLAAEKGKNTTEFPKGDATATPKTKNGLDGKAKGVKGLAAQDGTPGKDADKPEAPNKPKVPGSTVGQGKVEPVSENAASSKTEVAELAKKMNEMRAEFSAMSLFNAKLQFANRFLVLEDLTKVQKTKIVEQLSLAKNLQEAEQTFKDLKTAYEKSKAAKGAKSTPVNESTTRRGSGSKPTSVVTEAKSSLASNTAIDLDRLQVLAGLVKS